LGTGAQFFKDKIGSVLNFRTIKGGEGFKVTQGVDEILISKDLLIGPDTYIYIKLDTTSLGAATRSQFYNMKNTIMKSALQDLYATGKRVSEGNLDPATNGSNRYDTHVFVQDDGSEEPFLAIVSALGDAPNTNFPADATNIISMFFIDECSSSYTPSDSSPIASSYMTATFQSNITTMKSRITSIRSTGATFKGFVFNVRTGNHGAFESLIGHLNTNAGLYAGTYGLNDDSERWGVKCIPKVVNAWGTLIPNTITTATWPAIDAAALDATRRFRTYEQYLLEVVIDSVNDAGAQREIKAEVSSGSVLEDQPTIDLEHSIAIWTSRKNISNPNYSSAKIYGQFYSVLTGTQSVDINNSGYSIPAFSSNTIYVNWEIGNNQRVSLASATGNVIMNFINPKAGAHYILKVNQGTTPRTITFGTNYTGALNHDANITSIGAVVLDPTNYQIDQLPSSVTVIRMWFDGSTYHTESFGDSNSSNASVNTTDLGPAITLTLNTPPTVPAPIVGDRYLIPTTPAATGAWTAKENQVAEWNGTTWVYTVPVADNVIFITDTLTTLRYNGTAWVTYKGVAILQNGNKLTNHINIGSNDNYNLNFKTNAIQRMTILKDGNVGIGLTGPNAKLQVRATPATTGTTVFKVDGNVGELFTVTDNLTGSLMSVNDISGLPILEVFDNNTILMGDYQAPSLYSTTKSVVGVVTNNVVYQFVASLYTSVFFEYNVQNSTNLRAGTIMAVWNNTTIEFTETSTMDIGNTSGINFNVVLTTILGVVYVQLRATTISSGWTIKSIIRTI
jgi:hypothetical protein